MPKDKFTKKPEQVDAEQYASADPLPAIVCTCRGPIDFTGPHVHTVQGGVAALHDTDWIVMDPFQPAYASVLTDEEFQARYKKNAAAEARPGEEA